MRKRFCLPIHSTQYSVLAAPQSIPVSSSRVRLTREGRYWLLLSLVLLVLGLYKGVNLLCLLAYVMLACLALNLWLAGRRLKHVRGSRRIGEPAFAGEPFAVELRGVNTGRGPQFGVGLEDAAPGQTGHA